MPELDPRVDPSAMLKATDDLILRAVTICRNDPRTRDVRATASVVPCWSEGSQ